MPWDDKNKGSGPWGSGDNGGSGSGGDNSPWNRPGNGKSGGGSGGNDLEDQMRRMQERFRRGSGGGGKGRGGSAKGPNLGPFGFIIIGGVALFAWLATGVVVVGPGDQAVVFRFGEWKTNFTPGLHFHLPSPIEQHEIVEVEKSEEERIGASSQESLMLTEDENIADIEFTVKWKVKSDAPQDFVLNVKGPQEAVRQVAESVMREVVGKSKLQPLITTERGAVEQEVTTQIQTLLDDYRAGILIEGVQIAKSDPPAQVIEAFNDVNVAEQDAEKNINEATRDANQVVPKARGTAQRLLQEAEGYRDQIVADAEGEASRFEQIYEEYRKAPRVTRERMYLETMERVLERTDKTILDSNSGAVPYLPLDRVTPRSGGN
jgi:membrane protease subunit HflK